VVAHADGFDPDLADGPGDDGGGASTDLLAHAARTGVAELIPDLAGAAVADPVAVAHAWPLLRLGLGSALAVPLTVRGRVLGAMGFARSAGHPAFALEDRALAEDLARRTALAIENARLYEEARASEARFRTLVDATVAGVVLADAEGGLAYANDAYLRIVGYDRADFDAGRVRWTDLTPPEWAEADRRSIAEARRDGVSAPFEKEYRRKDGERVPVLVAVARTEEAGREQLIGFVLDIGERKRLERLRQDFLAMVTHDLRTPLTTVRASAQMLQRWAEYRAPTVEAILEQTGRMQRLLDDLADVVRLEEGRLEPRRGEVDLVDLARRQTEALAGQAAGRRLLVVAPPGPVVGPWDGDRLVQVLQNLLANALKYAPDGGDVVVTVEADAARGEARLAVRDGGPGIPPEHQARLFERFYRADATGAGGLGLGLYIARMIVEAHGGRIAVASAPGAGSTFTVTLPLAG
jgi:PAS domain S-box-containing protein